MSSTLGVYLHDRKAGVLTDLGNAQIQFQYDHAYVEGRSPALSQSLPLSLEPYSDQAARPFFSGVLPDDQQLENLAQQLKVSRRNVFKLLREVGGECAGAVSLHDESDTASKTDAASRQLLGKPLDDSTLGELLKTAQIRPIQGGDDGIRLSLAGAQSKLAVVIYNNQIYLSSPEVPSTHILKPSSTALPGLVENEYFCMRLAKASGIEVPDVKILKIENQIAYQVQRYDRTQHAQGTKRLHQEDFCQALGIVPENKYENEGGPKISDCITLIQRTSSQPAVDYRKLLERIVFNYLIGNNDAHAKNFSLLYQSGSCQLAPAYDLVCTSLYPQLSDRMAMKIGSRKSASELHRRHWERLLPDTKTSKNLLENTVLTMCSRVEKGLEKENSLPATTSDGTTYKPTTVDIANLVKSRLTKLKTLFADSTNQTL